jgi:hypothetical protein
MTSARVSPEPVVAASVDDATPVAVVETTVPAQVAAPVEEPVAFAEMPPAASTPAQSGMLVGRDAEGNLGVMPEVGNPPIEGGGAELDPGVTFEPVTSRFGYGTIVDLKGQFQEYSVVAMGPDGRPVWRCASDPIATLKQPVEAREVR